MSKKKLILAALPVVSVVLLGVAGKMENRKKARVIKAVSLAAGVFPGFLKIFS